MDKIEVVISGIKCDNVCCNFRDDSVLYEDYPKYVNKPCDECGHVLLTEYEYNGCKRMYAAVDCANRVDAMFNKINPVYYLRQLIQKFKR